MRELRILVTHQSTATKTLIDVVLHDYTAFRQSMLKFCSDKKVEGTK